MLPELWGGVWVDLLVGLGFSLLGASFVLFGVNFLKTGYAEDEGGERFYRESRAFGFWSWTLLMLVSGAISCALGASFLWDSIFNAA